MSYRRMIQAIETHSGEPMRVITGGVPHIPGDSVYAQMRWLERNDDQLRLLMLREPRGYPPLCCNLIVPPKHPDAAAGFIIMEQVEYPVMSGGNTIAVATVLLETGMIPMQEPLTTFTLEAPAGLIAVEAECRDGRVTRVTFENVPAFCVHRDTVIDVPELGQVTVDVAWGGMFYVIADAAQLELDLVPGRGRDITRASALILRAAQDQLPVEHPNYPGVGITIAQLSGPTGNPHADRRNAVTVASGPVALTTRPPGPAGSTGAPVAPVPAPRWRCCTRRGSSGSESPSVTKASSGTSTQASWSGRSRSATGSRWFPRSAGARGSRGTAPGCSARTTRTRTGSPSATSGRLTTGPRGADDRRQT